MGCQRGQFSESLRFMAREPGPPVQGRSQISQLHLAAFHQADSGGQFQFVMLLKTWFPRDDPLSTGLVAIDGAGPQEPRVLGRQARPPDPHRPVGFDAVAPSIIARLRPEPRRAGLVYSLEI